MRGVIVSKVVKHTRVSAERKKRQINVPNSYIQVMNNLKSAQPTMSIMHKHSFGWLMLVLDRNANVLMAWTSCKAYQPIRARFMRANHMRKRLLDLIATSTPFNLYTNDGSLLMPVPKTWTVRVYENGLFDLIQSLIPTATTTAAAATNVIEAKNEHVKIPTYAEIHELDPTITRADYNRIYG